MIEMEDWLVKLPEKIAELTKTWPGVVMLFVLGVIMLGKLTMFVVELIREVAQFFKWRKRLVTVVQGGENVAIGNVTSLGHQWLSLCKLWGFAGNVRCAFCRNRIDYFRDYVPGDENFLVRPGVKAKPTVSGLEEQKAEDEEDDGGE